MFNDEKIIEFLITLTPTVIFFMAGYAIHITQKTGRLFLDIGELESYNNYIEQCRKFLYCMWIILFISASWNIFNLICFLRG